MQDVLLDLHSKQRSGGQLEEVTQRYHSKAVAKPSGWFFSYHESIGDVGEVRTVLKISDAEVTILRQGSLEMKQRFQSGVSTESIYHSPFGRFRMKVHTRRMQVTKEGNRPTAVDISYQLWLNDAYVGEVDLAFQLDWR
ncbi:DUF1934 domain-containing protein [Brevibacillus humidisoli]|uniref:DUF1934 domain-containing protein n=1 Tax=Brevibacillus humidisoli TaxID=2895522 RepID=UPI001E374796|nr:DUF1934 domain-containing protein [Brevibacillus humidisoli]UFJ40217.1 DUF1934 domain-containing protein [Brevibacillus humidisoli]